MTGFKILSFRESLGIVFSNVWTEKPITELNALDGLERRCSQTPPTQLRRRGVASLHLYVCRCHLFSSSHIFMRRTELPPDRRHDHEALECNVVVEGLLCEGTFARREAGWLGVGRSPCGTSVVGTRRMNQKKKQKAMSEDKSLLASDPFPSAPQVLKEKESPNKTNGKMSHANFNTCVCWSGT